MRAFDGKTRVFTTCHVCGQQQLIVQMGDVAHPCCDEDQEPDKSGSFATGWLSTLMAGDAESARLTSNEIYNEVADPLVPMLEHALTYASYGWPVFPLRPYFTRCDGGKECRQVCRCPKKPARPKGLSNATTDPGKIERFWKANPHNNIGLRTGDKFDAIDIDMPAGVDSFKQFLNAGRIPDLHAVVATSSGGAHLYITRTGNTNRRAIKPGIDFRGKGGYVVAPHSVLDDEHRWSWIVEPSPTLTEPEY